MKNIHQNSKYKIIKEKERLKPLAILLSELEKGRKSGYVDEDTFNKRFNI